MGVTTPGCHALLTSDQRKFGLGGQREFRMAQTNGRHLDRGSVAPLIDELWTRRFVESEKRVSAYMYIPQLTCGQFTSQEVLGVIEAEVEMLSRIRELEDRIDFLQNGTFFGGFDSRFRNEIAEFELMKRRLGTESMDEIRQAYLEECGYPEDHLARHFNPYYRD
jgi:hypothetical protein